MIREERDADFWSGVINHPAVRPAALLDPEALLSTLLDCPTVIPLASEHGGYLFIQRDGLGRVHELHSLFTPEGWGREALLAGKAALVEMWSRGMDLLVTYEIANQWRTRPPASFGFKACGDFRPSSLGHDLKTWALTRNAWSEAPANRRRA